MSHLKESFSIYFDFPVLWDKSIGISDCSSGIQNDFTPIGQSDCDNIPNGLDISIGWLLTWLKPSLYENSRSFPIELQ